MVEHVLGKDGVTGSIPVSSFYKKLGRVEFCFLRDYIMREIIELECTVCKNRNYTTLKNKKTNPNKLELSKYCRFCKKHTVHKEIK